MAFAYKRSITIDHNLVSSDLINFPLLISLTSDDLRSVGNGGHVEHSSGYDICFFADEDGETPIPWDLVPGTYDPVTGTLAEVWALLSLMSASSDPVIWMFYGDPSISTYQSTREDVWDDDYLAVWHFGDGTSLDLTDSTANGNDGTGVNTPTAVAGKIGGALQLASASTEYVTTGNAIDPTAITVSGWVKATTLPSAYNVVWSRIAPAAVSFTQVLVKSNGKIACYVNCGGSSPNYDGSGSHTLATGTWYHLTLTYSAAAGLIGYVNGAQDGTAGANGGLFQATATGRIGSDSETASREWNGEEDELRISRIARDPEFVAADFAIQDDPEAWETLGAEIPLAGGGFNPAWAVVANRLVGGGIL